MGLSIKRRVTLDLSQRGAQVTIPFSVGDTVAHEVIFTIRDGAELVELPEGVMAAIAIKNGYEGTGCLDSCVIDHVNNTVIYTPTVGALAEEGNISCTMTLSDTDGAVIGTPTFIFAVSEGDNANTEAELGEALKQNTSWGVIAETVEKAQAAAGSAQAASESAKEAAKSELAAHNAASMAAKNAADAVRTELEDLSGAAETSANEASDSAEAAEKSAIAAAESENNSLDIVTAVREYAGQTYNDAEAAKDSSESAKGYALMAQQEADRALEYGTNLLVQVEGTDKNKVMSQQAVTNALSQKVDRSEIGNIGGGSSVEVVQDTGDSETAVMSQRAVTENFYKVTDTFHNVRVCAFDVNGKPVLKGYGGTNQYYIVERQSGGQIALPTTAPAQGAYQAISRKHVEDLIGAIDDHTPRFRHSVLLDFMDYDYADNGTAADGITNIGYLSFDCYSTSSTPYFGYESTLQDFYDFIVNEYNGTLSCCGRIVAGSSEAVVCGIDAYNGNLNFFCASDGNTDISLNVSGLKGIWSANNGWETVIEVKEDNK